ncbi:MAG: ABC transporter permease [Pseudomonadota bacterium]|nr:ABC transporter permease [Pseudomonadota bacterium]
MADKKQPTAGGLRTKQNEDLGEITKKTFYEINEPYLFGGGFIIVFLAIWEAIPHVFTLPKGISLFFTTPITVFERLFSMLDGSEKMFDGNPLTAHLASSTEAFLSGLGLSIIVALPLGIILGRSKILNAMFDPFVTAINATPRLVFLPIIMIWVGIGYWTVTLIVFIGAVFPLLINTYAGVKNADQLLINVVKSFGANEWEINKLVILPNSLPFIIAGLRLAIGRAILGIVVAEFFGGTTMGMGVIMVDASGKFHVDVVFVGLIMFMTLSLILTAIVKIIENKLSRWRPQQVKTF